MNIICEFIALENVLWAPLGRGRASPEPPQVGDGKEDHTFIGSLHKSNVSKHLHDHNYTAKSDFPRFIFGHFTHAKTCICWVCVCVCVRVCARAFKWVILGSAGLICLWPLICKQRRILSTHKRLTLGGGRPYPTQAARGHPLGLGCRAQQGIFAHNPSLSSERTVDDSC